MHTYQSYHNGRRTIPVVLIALVLTLLTASGCVKVGPDYLAPDLNAQQSWHGELKDGLRQEPADPQSLARWWTTLGDPVLDTLMDRAVNGNLTLREARARVWEARARRGLTAAGLYPEVNTSASMNKSRSSKNSGNTGREIDLYQAGFDAGWEVDIFGGVARSIEAADAEVTASEEDLRDVIVTLLGEVAAGYVEVRTFQSRLQAARENLAAQESTYELIASRYQAGLSDELTVQQARYILENTRSQIPSLEAGLETAKNRLAVLLGEEPGSVHAELLAFAPIPAPPVSIAVGVPADSLRRRPDIRVAERNLAAQTARIGMATADLYPRFALAGSIGLESFSTGNLFETGNSKTYSLGPSISWPLFDAGSIRRNIEVQNALQEQFLTRYQMSVLTALQEIQDAMERYAQEQLRRQALESATRAAKRAVFLSKDKYKAGLVDFTDVLDAQRSQLTYEDQLATSEGAVTTHLISLYKALGGGWESYAARKSVPADDVAVETARER
jgi:NodT family efflux transporter outer membrane factor (OMF) lipoprotein